MALTTRITPTSTAFRHFQYPRLPYTGDSAHRCRSTRLVGVTPTR